MSVAPAVESVVPTSSESVDEPSTARQSASWGTWLLLLVLCYAAYANSFWCGLTFDSQTIIGADPRIRVASWENIELIFTRNYWWPKHSTTLFRPLTTLSYWCNYHFLGNHLRPGAYHVVNFALHVVVVWLMYRLVLWTSKMPRAALIAAALFAVHPLNVETVTNLVGRADLFTTVAVLGGLWLHVNCPVQGWRDISKRAGIGICLAVGVFCKENAITLLAVVPWYDLVMSQGIRCETTGTSWLGRWVFDIRAWWSWVVSRRAWRSYWALLPGTLLLFGVRAWMFGNAPSLSEPPGDNPLVLGTLPVRLLTASKIVWMYAYRMVYPISLSNDYSFDAIPLYEAPTASGWDNALCWVGVSVLVLWAVWILTTWRRRPEVCFWLGFALIAFVPVSNFLLLIGTIMGERLTYVPLIGLLAATTLALAPACERWVMPRPKLASGLGCVAGVLVMLLIARTLLRSRDWHDDIALWRSALNAQPASYKVYKGMAGAIWHVDRTGKFSAKAVELQERALRIFESAPIPPALRYPHTHASLGWMYIVQGDRLAGQRTRGPEDEVDALPDAIDSDADDRAVRMEEARVYYQQAREVLERGRDLDRATFQSVIDLYRARGKTTVGLRRAGVPNVYLALGSVYERQQRYRDAQEAYEVLLEFGVAAPESWLFMGEMMWKLGQREAAVVSFIKGLLADPDKMVTWARLAQLSLTDDDLTPAVVVDEQGEYRLNLREPLIRALRDQASREVVELCYTYHQPDDAALLRRRAIERLGCPAELFSTTKAPAR